MAAPTAAAEVKCHQPSSRKIASARAWARGIRLSRWQASSGLWAFSPIGPMAQTVGAPSAAVKPESAEPPVYSPPTVWPSSAAAAT